MSGAAIRQGCRTTINDELKQWKDECTKADALGGDLPAAVADAMRALWVAAVEQGEAVFAEHRGALETALADAEQQQATISQERDGVLATSTALTEQCEALRHQVDTLQARVESEVTAKNQALQDGQALQQKLIALQSDTADTSRPLSSFGLDRSMIQAGIFDGDWIVVDRELVAKDDDVVVAVFNNDFTIRRLSKIAGKVALLPENPHFKPIVKEANDTLGIWGVVTNCLRRLQRHVAVLRASTDSER